MPIDPLELWSANKKRDAFLAGSEKPVPASASTAMPNKARKDKPLTWNDLYKRIPDAVSGSRAGDIVAEMLRVYAHVDFNVIGVDKDAPYRLQMTNCCSQARRVEAFSERLDIDDESESYSQALVLAASIVKCLQEKRLPKVTFRKIQLPDLRKALFEKEHKALGGWTAREV